MWLPTGKWTSLHAFLSARFPHVDSEIWKERMGRGEVVDSKGSKLGPDSPYYSGICIFYYRELIKETPIPFEENIIYQDDHILVADKPHFLPVIPSGRFLHETLLVRLKKRTGLKYLTPIHRIDRETAGIVMFSHEPLTRGKYQALFQRKEIKKSYEAVGKEGLSILSFPLIYKSRMMPGTPFFRMEEVNGVPNTETHIDLIENRGSVGLYQLQPITGKKHQLRVHLAALGIPIVNDTFYPNLQPCKADDVSHPLKLLAKSLSFKDPITGQEHYFESHRCL